MTDVTSISARTPIEPTAPVLRTSGPEADIPQFPTNTFVLGTGTISMGELLAQARADALNRAATSAEPEQATVAGANSLIRLVYGRRNLGAQISLIAFDTAGNLLLRCVWCKGPIDAIEGVKINDTALPAGVGHTPYLGAPGQGIDPWISTALAWKGQTYVDSLPGVAYSVLRIPPAAANGFPQVTATVRGLKVRRIALEAIALNGTSAYGSVPHGAQNTVDSDFEIIVGAKATDWTPAAEQTLLSKWNATGNLRSYRLALTTAGALRLEVSTNGTAVTGYSSTANITAANGSLLWLRARFQKTDGSNSRASFATSLDGLTWSALGSVVTGATIATLFAGTEPLRLGCMGGPTGYFAGSVFAAKMTAGAGVVCDLVAFEAPENVATWYDAAGAAWTLTNATTPNSRAWSQDPVDCLCDFIVSPSYGARARVHVGGAIYANAITSMQIGSPAEAYAQLDLTIDQAMPVDDWVDVLRDYAYCFVVPEGDTYFVIRDWDDPATVTFDQDTIADHSLTYEKRSASDTPTVVQVTYTDASADRWRDYPAPPTYATGVLEGTVPRRMSQISKPGLTRFSEVNRYQIQRLNKGILGDLVVRFRAFDEAAAVRKGSIIALSHPIGFSSKAFRVLDISADAPGRWQIIAQEHDPLMYSTEVASGPSVVDTILPDPDDPPVPTIGDPPTEELYQVQTGRYASRLRFTWDDVGGGYPFVENYVVTVYKLGVGVAAIEGPFPLPRSTFEYATGALEENVDYRLAVAVQTSTGTIGAQGTLDATVTGKNFPPGNVPWFSGIELGGEIRFTWGQAVDYDLTAYEIRKSALGGSWETATLVDFIAAPGQAYTTRQVPAGWWTFWIKSRDSVRNAEWPNGQECATALHFDLEVHLDSGASIVASYDFTPTGLGLTNFVACPEGWVSNYGDTWNAQFSAAMSGYTQALYSYHATTGTSVLLTEAKDFGASYTGQWVGSIDYDDLAGTATIELGLSADGSSWTWHSPMSAVASARHARIRVTTTGVALVRSLGNAYCAVVVDIGAVQATAVAAQDDATTALANAATAQSTANTAQSTANTANTTANAALPKAGGTMTGTLNLGNQATTAVKTVSFNGIIDDGSSGTAKTIDFGAGQYHKLSMTGSCTFTFTAPAGPCVVQLDLTQDATGSRIATWPASLKWPTNYATADKALSTAAGARDLLVLRWDGTDYIANLIKGVA